MTMLHAPSQRPLLVAGAILFLLGLLQGGVIQSFTNPRMALSAHLTAVQCGMALMIAGLVWPAVSLSARAGKAAQWGIIFGMYGLWLGLDFSAATGASENLPIAGAGHQAGATTEALASALILGSSGIMILGWLLFTLGLIRSQASQPEV
jgi:(hydroxyamino)benzene mutase